MCLYTCLDVCEGWRVPLRVHMCACVRVCSMCVHMCVEIRDNMCVHIYADMRIDMRRHACRHSQIGISGMDDGLKPRWKGLGRKLSYRCFSLLTALGCDRVHTTSSLDR